LLLEGCADGLYWCHVTCSAMPGTKAKICIPVFAGAYGSEICRFERAFP
jgi:hypothetical protein